MQKLTIECHGSQCLRVRTFHNSGTHSLGQSLCNYLGKMVLFLSNAMATEEKKFTKFTVESRIYRRT